MQDARDASLKVDMITGVHYGYIPADLANEFEERELSR